MRFLPKGLNPLKIQTIFKLDFSSEFCNSKSREILRLGQNRNLFYSKQAATMPNVEIFGYQEGGVCILKLEVLEIN
jgi:hypothetical protein